MYNEISRDALLISLSNIMSGLLATGHYLYDKPSDGDFSLEPDFKCGDYGEDWRAELDPHIDQRFVPHAEMHAKEILERFCKHINNEY